MERGEALLDQGVEVARQGVGLAREAAEIVEQGIGMVKEGIEAWAVNSVVHCAHSHAYVPPNGRGRVFFYTGPDHARIMLARHIPGCLLVLLTARLWSWECLRLSEICSSSSLRLRKLSLTSKV